MIGKEDVNIMNYVDLPSYMLLDTIGGFYNEYVYVSVRYFCGLEMPVFFARVVSGVEYFDSFNFYEKHGCPENMACVIASEFDAFVFHFLMVVQHLYLLQ